MQRICPFEFTEFKVPIYATTRNVRRTETVKNMHVFEAFNKYKPHIAFAIDYYFTRVSTIILLPGNQPDFVITRLLRKMSKMQI